MGIIARAVATAVAVGLLVAGCGDDGGSSAPPASSTGSTTSADGTPTSEPVSPTKEPRPKLLRSTTKAAADPPPGATVVEMHGPPPMIIPRDYTVESGRTTVFFIDNTSPVGDSHGSHTLAIGPAVDEPVAVSELVLAAHSATFTVHGLEPGRYAIWCDFLGHAALGQTGTLRVR